MDVLLSTVDVIGLFRGFQSTGFGVFRACLGDTGLRCTATKLYVWCKQARTGLLALVLMCAPCEQVMAEPVFGTLRTKEQLGYSVHCSTRLTHGVLGFAFVIVSGASAGICAMN